MDSRAQFETWFMSDVVESEVVFPSYEDGEYVQGHVYELEFYLTLQSMWMAWQASRAAMNNELPLQHEARDY